MTVANSARRSARRVATSRPLEILFRIGFVGYGLLHLAVAWLAVQLALGRPAGENSQSGAFQTLVRQPFGRYPQEIRTQDGLLTRSTPEEAAKLQRYYDDYSETVEDADDILLPRPRHGRPGRAAEEAEVGADRAEPFGQERDDRLPEARVAEPAVQEQDRRATAGLVIPEARPVDVDYRHGSTL